MKIHGQGGKHARQGDAILANSPATRLPHPGLCTCGSFSLRAILTQHPPHFTLLLSFRIQLKPHVTIEASPTSQVRSILAAHAGPWWPPLPTHLFPVTLCSAVLPSSLLLFCLECSSPKGCLDRITSSLFIHRCFMLQGALHFTGYVYVFHPRPWWSRGTDQAEVLSVFFGRWLGKSPENAVCRV